VNRSVGALGSASVKALGSASVKALGSASVKALGQVVKSLEMSEKPLEMSEKTLGIQVKPLRQLGATRSYRLWLKSFQPLTKLASSGYGLPSGCASTLF
jgi:hypothetical protein